MSPTRMTAAALLAPFLITQSAFAYHLSPPKTRATLDGVLQFVNGSEPFHCHVHVVLLTRGGNHSGYPEIKKIDINASGGDCNAVKFDAPFPWTVQVTSASGGEIFGGAWVVGGNSCARPNNIFTVNSAGSWTISPGCLSGTLQSNPAVTIVP